jgi:hypothetical protein
VEKFGMSDNETVKGIFGYKTEGGAEGWEKMHDDIYTS